MGLPAPSAPANPFSLVPKPPAKNPFAAVPSGISQMPVPPSKGIPLPPRAPAPAPLDFSPAQAGFKALSFLGLALTGLDLIGQAGAYQWRDNLIDQITGGNTNKSPLPPPFKGGQSAGVQYSIQFTATLSNGQTRYGFQNSFGSETPWDDAYTRSFGFKIDGPVENAFTVAYTGGFSWNIYYKGNYATYFFVYFSEVTSFSVYSVVRTDGQPDTGGDPYAGTSGADNPNPFSAPPTESPPEIPPASPPRTPPASPPEIPPLAPPASPPLSPPEIPPASPPASPPNGDPLAPPLAPPASPPLAPPASPPLAPPNPDLSGLIDKLNETNKNLAKLRDELEQTNQRNRLRKKQDCCEPEFVSISVKKFSKCGDDGKPVFTNVNVSVLKGTEQANIKMFESVANTEALQCKECNSVVTFPDSWAGKVPDERPQAVIYYREWDGSKFGAYTHSVTIPHYSKPKGFKPSLPIIKKGSYFGILKFKDNSQIYVNCESITEAKRVIASLRQLSGTAAKGARGKYGEYGDGDLKRVTTKAVRLDFYSKGRENAFADWSVEL